MRPSVALVVTTSFTPTYCSPWSVTSRVGSSSTRNSPPKTRARSRSSASGAIEARKPTRPKLTPITGTSLPSRRASVRRIVPSPPTATVRSASAGSSTTVVPDPAATFRTRSTAVATSMRPCATTATVSGLDGCGDLLVEIIGKRRGVRLREMKEELPVALRAGEPGVYDRDRTRIPAERRFCDLADHPCADRFVAHDAALADIGAARLELRFDQHHRLPGGRRELQRGRQGDPHGDERDVADDELRCERQLGDRARVRPLEHRDAPVAAQARVELPVADVDRDHARGAALEEHVGEASRRRADVEAVEARRVDPERVERVGELLPAARDVGWPRLQLEVGVLVHLLPRLLVAGHEAGEDERLRLRARLGEAALHEEDVEPLLHRRAPAT